MADKICLVIPATGAYRKWAEVTARSACEGCSLPIEVKILDWPEIERAGVSRAKLEGLGSWHGSAITYAKMYMTELFPQIDRVIVCDADVLFRGDLAKLWKLGEECFDGKVWLLPSRDSQPPWREWNPYDAAWFAAQGLTIKRPENYFCAGFMMMDLKAMRDGGWSSLRDEFLARYDMRTIPFGEQGVMNYLLQDHLRILPRQWGCFSGDTNDDVDYNGDCAIHYVSDAPWERKGLTRLMSDAVALWRKAAGMSTGGWRRWLWCALRATAPLWRWEPHFAWHFRTALKRQDRREVPGGSRQKRILHVVPGLNEPWNGIAGAAKDIAKSQGADIVDTREFLCSSPISSSSTSTSNLNLSTYDEIWVHSNWWFPTIRACLKVLKAGVKLVRMPHANLDPLRMRSKGWKKLPIWWLIERRLMNRAARVVVTCEAEREWCVRAGVKAEFEVVDLKRYFRLEGGRHNGALPSCDPLHVLYLGRRHPLKGVESLEQAIKELNSVVQPSTSNLQPRFALRIVSDHTGDELEQDWEWCDVLCLPTLSENFGLVVAEALERGKRVITTDGAPAWRTYFEQHPDAGIYLKGYREGSEETRVNLIKDAIMYFVG